MGELLDMYPCVILFIDGGNAWRQDWTGMTEHNKNIMNRIGGLCGELC